MIPKLSDAASLNWLPLEEFVSCGLPVVGPHSEGALSQNQQLSKVIANLFEMDVQACQLNTVFLSDYFSND